MNRIGLTVAVVATLLTGSAWGQSKAGASRVDFDDQLVQGQVNKGAVHLIERKDSDLGSLVKKRTSYRKEILAGTDVTEAKPALAVASLPVVKSAELKGEAIEVPAAKPVVAPAAKSPAVKPVVNSKKGPAKKSPAKVDAKQSKKVGGSNVVSRR